MKVGICSPKLENAGVTLELLAQRINEGLDAMKTIFISRDGKKYDVVDFKERRKMCELCCYLIDLFPHQRHEVSGRTLEQLLEETYGKE